MGGGEGPLVLWSPELESGLRLVLVVERRGVLRVFAL